MNTYIFTFYNTSGFNKLFLSSCQTASTLREAYDKWQEEFPEGTYILINVSVVP